MWAAPLAWGVTLRRLRRCCCLRRLESRFGGGHARSAVTNYLPSDVIPLLREGRYRDSLRKKLPTAVAELNQLAGWVAYDVGDSISGRRHLQNAMHQCQDVGDEALAAEMLAGMSHQAAFLRSAALVTDLARGGEPGPAGVACLLRRCLFGGEVRALLP